MSKNRNRHATKKVELVEFKVDLPKIFQELAKNPSTSVVRMALQITLRNLILIAQHAQKTNDKYTLERLEALRVVERQEVEKKGTAEGQSEPV